jgi:hypothetical protein
MRIYFLLFVFLLNSEIYLFIKVFWINYFIVLILINTINIFLINNIYLFWKFCFIFIFLFFIFILVRWYVIILSVGKMIRSLWKFWLINIILRKLLVYILICMEGQRSTWALRFLFINNFICLFYHLIIFY